MFCLALMAYAQAGGAVYSFLNLPASSRLAAMGGSNVSIRDNDINLSFSNPALLTQETDQCIGLNYTAYPAGIHIGSVIYGIALNDNSYIAAGIQFVNYGQFQEVTEENMQLGTFSASDYALNLMYAQKLTEKWTLGAIVKPIYSSYESYSSFGIATDIGINYNNEESLWSGGLVIKNIGTELKSYYSSDGAQHHERLPFEIMMGASKRFAHAPLRISITATNLQKWDLYYSKLNTSLYAVENAKSNFTGMLLRHLILGVDFLPSNNFYLTVSYNFRRAAEMSINNVRSMSGFAGGFGMKISKFQAGFSVAQYQIGALSYNFSLTTSLNQFGL
ncbi:MAG: type IX secretion system protein PorQ [Bacteroidota bacterium]|nr:type IX secretion system protein PorQ [Bacteroidota bacterium]